MKRSPVALARTAPRYQRASLEILRLEERLPPGDALGGFLMAPLLAGADDVLAQAVLATPDTAALAVNAAAPDTSTAVSPWEAPVSPPTSETVPSSSTQQARQSSSTVDPLTQDFTNLAGLWDISGIQTQSVIVPDAGGANSVVPPGPADGAALPAGPAKSDAPPSAPEASGTYSNAGQRSAYSGGYPMLTAGAGYTPTTSDAPANSPTSGNSAIPPASGQIPSTAAKTSQDVAQTYGKLPLRFEANVGQTDAQVQFLSRGPGYSVFLTSTEAVLSLSPPQTPPGLQAPQMASDPANGPSGPPQVMRLQLVGSNPSAQAVGLDLLETRTNYFIGSDPAQWHSNVPNYGRVVYQGVYPGIDLVYHGSSQQQLEYDFDVAPGADPSVIHLSVQGAQKLRLDDQGNLVVGMDGPDLVEHAPVIYQEVNGVRQAVAGRYVLTGEDQIGFTVGDYDRGQPLVIDPSLSYSTFLGGSGADAALGVGVDSPGNAYVTGYTSSIDSPFQNPVQTVPGSLANISTDGGLTWSPSSNGLRGTTLSTMIFDAAATSTIYAGTDAGAFKSTDRGATWSSMSTGLNGLGVNALAIAPTTPNVTFYAGTMNGLYKSTDGGSTWRFAGLLHRVNALAINPSTASTMFAATEDGVYKTTDGDATWTRSLSLSNATTATITFDRSDSATLLLGATSGIYRSTNGGASWGQPLPNVDVRALAYDRSSSPIFYAASSEDSTDQLYKSTDHGITWLAITNSDLGSQTLAVDPTNPATVYAGTSAGLFRSSTQGSLFTLHSLFNTSIASLLIDPAVPNRIYAGSTTRRRFSDASRAFVAKLDPSGSRLIYTAYLGGSAGRLQDRAQAIAVDGTGNAYITGLATSVDFPTTTGAFQTFFEQGTNFRRNNDTGSWQTLGMAGLPDRALYLRPDPVVPSTLYTVVGGTLYKSTDNANTWRSASTGLPVYMLGVVIDPVNSSNLYLIPSFASVVPGPYKSTDGGNTWQLSNNGLPNSGANIYGIFVSPSNPSVLYATNPSGLYKSSNGGGQWFPTGYPGSAAGADIVIAPGSADVLYANGGSGVLRSTDGGATWVALQTPSVRLFAVDRSSALSVYGIERGSNNLFYHSTDGGDHWGSPIGQLPGCQLSSCRVPVVDTQATATFYFFLDGQILKTTDGGAHWTGVQPPIGTGSVDRLIAGAIAQGTLYVTLNPGNGQNAFVAKLTADGSRLAYSTYLGSTGPDEGDGIAVDGSGNAYVVGTTSSRYFPTRNAFQTSLRGSSNAFVTKLNSTGSDLVYSTYLGGSGADNGMGIALDGSANAYVTGTTDSTDFPQISHFGPSGNSAFVSRIASTGSALIYSDTLSSATLSAIAVDGNGSAYVTGSASSAFPQTTHFGPPGNGALVAKVDPTGTTLVYSDVLYSASGSSIAVDSTGSAYVTGDSLLGLGSNLPLQDPLQPNGRSMVAKLNPSGQNLVYSGYFGGGYDIAAALAIDTSGNAYVVGRTPSLNFPLVNPVQPVLGGRGVYVGIGGDAFVARISPVRPPLTDPQIASGSEPPFGDLGDAEDTGGAGTGVYLHNGEFHRRVVDLEIAGRGFDWRFERAYRSGVQFDGPLGRNWDFRDNRRLRVVTPNNWPEIRLTFPNAKVGDVVRFDGLNRADLYVGADFNTDGNLALFTSPNGFFTRLLQNRDRTFTERDQFGTLITYTAPDDDGRARITSIVDRAGNTMRYLYGANGQLQHVIDTLGRSIDYFYNGSRLQRVQDFLGRTVTFAVDGNGDLQSVTSPAVTGTPTGNDFPNGKTERYTYSSGFSDPRLNHHLRTITAPDEVAAGGSARVTVIYVEDLQSADVGRVRTLNIGGTNASGVPAGGTITYAYQQLTTTPPPDYDTPVFQTTVTDRNGNQREYRVNKQGNIVRKREFANRGIRPDDPTFFETTYRYSKDYLLLQELFPQGNRVNNVYDSSSSSRFRQGNLLQTTRTPDAASGGDQSTIVMKFTYEPIFNQVRTIIDARGNDASYQPPIGTASAARYTTTFTFDYQEGTDYDRLAYNMGPGVTVDNVRGLLQTANVPMGLGDVDEDGVTNQLAGNVIRVQRPNVQLIVGSNEATVEGTTSQPIVELSQYNKFSQLVKHIDPERNVDLYEYYSEQDPNGDGTIENPAGDPNTGGYLKQVTRDTTADPRRDSSTNPTPVSIRQRYQYDEVGNVTRAIDGRGIATDYAVNQLNQVVQITRAAAHGLYGADPSEPLTLTDFQYRQRFFFDYNNNVVLKEVEDRGNTSNVQGNPPAADLPSYIVNPDPIGGSTAYVDTVFKYDILDKPIETVQEVVNGANPEFLRTKSRYDRNENLVLTIAPAGNAVATVYDERDLVFQTVAGTVAAPPQALLAGTDPASYDVRGGLPATTVSFYDGNRNLVESVAADDADGSFANDTKHPTGQSTGNNAANTLVDTNRNWIPNQWRGRQVRILSGTGPDQVATITSNTVDTLIVSAAWQTVPDNSSVYVILGDRTRALYDGFDRAVSTVDSVGNQSVTQYDPAGNVVRVSQFGPVGGASPTSDGPDTLATPVSNLGTIQAANLVSSNLLAATEYSPDELNRVFQTSRVLFVNTIAAQRPADVQEGASDIGLGALTPGLTQAIPGVTGITILGRVSSRDEFDRNSRQTFIVQDSLNTARTFYDGVDRAIQTLDPEGNTVEAAYDGNNNVIETRQTDVSQVAGIANEVFLATHFYDSLNRLQRTVDNLGQTMERRYDSRDNLVAQADGSGPTGPAITRRVYADGPRTVDTTNLFGNVARFYVDGLSRQTRQEQILTASGSGDGTHMGASLEGIKDKPGVTESFTPTPDPTQGSGNGLIRTGSIWDANSLQAALVDSQGNITLFLHDNLNRTVAETKGLVGNAFPLTKQALLGDRDILTPTTATLNDPAAIDPARINTQLADTKARVDAVFSLFPPLADVVKPPTSILTGYDPRGNVLIREDENKTRTYTKVDGIDREVALRVFRAGQNDSFVGDPLFAPQPAHLPTNPTFTVVGTTKEDFQYNGLSEETLATDNNDPTNPNALASVATAYDSLGRVIEEQQQHGALPVKAIDSAWRADGLRSSLTYPNNRVVTVSAFDHLDRPQSIGDQGAAQPIATYAYLGDRELVRSSPQNGTRQTYLNAAGTADDGYDGLGRPVQLQSLRANNSLIVGFTHGYDRADNKTGENKLHDATNNERYAYDSAYRLTGFTRPSGQAPLQSQFRLDGVGNWKQVDGETRQHSSVNEIVQRSTGGGAAIRSDDDGNEIDNGTFTFAWDFRNRLRAVVRKSDGAPIAAYFYDADGRRIESAVTNSGDLNGVTDFYLDRSQEIEEHNALDAVRQQFVFGANDEPLVQDFNLDAGGTRRLFYHQNTLGSTFALTDVAGNIVEGYQYDAYGRQTVYKPLEKGLFVTFTSQDIITPGGISGVANPFLYTGGRLDGETQLYHLGARYLDTDQGRFIGRDPLEYDAGDANLYGYTGENPTNLTDRSGMDSFWLLHPVRTVQDLWAWWNAPYSRAQAARPVAPPPPKDITDIRSYGDLPLNYDKSLTVSQGAGQAADQLRSMPFEIAGNAIYIGVMVSPVGAEDLLLAKLLERGGYLLKPVGNKLYQLWKRGKAGAKATEAEAKALVTEYKALKAAGLTAEQIASIGKIMPYKKAREITKGANSAIQAHHIDEARHLKNWKYSDEAIANAPSIILTKAEHDKFTKQLRNALPYGRGYTKQQVWKAYQKVYDLYPDWLKAIEGYFK